MEKIKTNLPTLKTIYWKWTPNEAGECPIKLRVTFKKPGAEHDEERKTYPVYHNGKKLFLNESTFKIAQDKNEKPRGGNKKVIDEIRKSIASSESQASIAIQRVTSNNKAFSWGRFESEFLVTDVHGGFLALFERHLNSIKAENRIGTYKAYNNAFTVFNKFRGATYEIVKRESIEKKRGKELSPLDITPKLLKDFDAFLVKRDCNKTTIGMYLRSLKVVYNIAADADPSLLENYPFARKQTDRNRYKIKTGSGHKGDALTIEQLRTFVALETTPETPQHEAKLLWLFSLRCRGMNMKDICLLKYRDIQGEVIHYVRAKTKDTETKESVMKIPVTDHIRTIISSIGNPNKRPNSYVFPIIPNGLASTYAKGTKPKSPEERVEEIIRQKIKMVNERLKSLCKDKLPDITTYWARHTFANLQKESGESIEAIRELLGHSDIRTTESYLKRFDEDRMKKADNLIDDLLKTA